MRKAAHEDLNKGGEPQTKEALPLLPGPLNLRSGTNIFAAWQHQ